jgi:hypothetical protein
LIFCFLVTIQSSSLQASSPPSQILSKISGTHKITLEISPAQPQVGICNFKINILDIKSQTYITNAKVEIFAYNNAEQKAYKSFALRNPSITKDYNAKLNLEISGNWEIKIDSELETNSINTVTFNVHVQTNPLQSQLEGTILWVFVFSLLIITPIIIWYKNKK